MKKLMAISLAILLLQGIMIPAWGEATPPLSSGVVNKTTEIRWGKGEQFPVLATVFAGTKLDVYEYDADWVLVLYETYGSYLGDYTKMSFYGYVSREDIDCDPPLEGETSPKADTGPGKKKGKRPKPLPSKQPGEPTPGPTKTPEGTKEPMPTVETMEEEFDWIIRTNGLQTQKVTTYDGITLSCSFSLMAQKAGGTAPSSDPAFNHGIRTPYAATAFYSMKLITQDYLDEIGLSKLTGTGGIDISMQASGAAFFLDTGAEDFALVSFTLPMQADGSYGMTVSGEMGDRTVNADTGASSFSGGSGISVQLRKSGGGYKFVLVGMKPGGGNLEFPAVLEKTFANPDRFKQEAAKADERRKKAQAERDRMMEEQKQKAEEEAAKADETKKKAEEEAAKLDEIRKKAKAESDRIMDEEIARIAEEIKQKQKAEEEAVNQPEDDNPPLVPLEPSPGDIAPAFPDGSSRLERKGPACA